jgi:hypothetical protein
MKLSRKHIDVILMTVAIVFIDEVIFYFQGKKPLGGDYATDGLFLFILLYITAFIFYSIIYWIFSDKKKKKHE